MRIMIDTNVFISALLFPNSAVSSVVESIIEDDHEIVLCREIIDELEKVTKRRKTPLEDVFKKFLENLPYTLAKNPQKIDVKKYPSIRDPHDLPILASAVENNVDILLTGDKDFLSLRPLKGFSLQILSPAEYRAKFMNNI